MTKEKKYFNQTISSYLDRERIKHNSSCQDTHQNRVSKRKNCHLLEVSHALLFKQLH